MKHSLQDGDHHGCGGSVADPHGHEGGEDHEAEHDGGGGAAEHHQTSESYSLVQTRLLHCQSHYQTAKIQHLSTLK